MYMCVFSSSRLLQKYTLLQDYIHVICIVIIIYSGFSSVFSIILNPTTTKFTDQVDVTSVSGFFHSNAWLGAATSLSGAIGGQLMGLIADR